MVAGMFHVEVFAGQGERDDLRAWLSGAGHEVGVRSFQDAQAPAHLVVVDGGVQIEPALQLCQRLRSAQNGHYTPILFITPDAFARARLAGLESGADAAIARPLDAAEFLAQAHALLRVKERHDRLASQADEALTISRRLQEAHERMESELALAQRLQESFLPQTLPELPRVKLAVKYKPHDRVGGDFYDVFRLDEKHLGFYVADAMGHGVPASLLTIFVKRGVRAKEISGQTYRLVAPTEVLYRLNRDLLEQQIPDLPFITMIYALFNCETGTLQFSRAGHPYPLYIPRHGKPVLWQQEGSLLGVFETKFHLQTRQLKPGDKLLLYTDGMDGASFEQHAVGLTSLLAAAEEFQALPIDEMVERLASDLFTQTVQKDDLTVFGVEMTD
ncbi:MAG: SpoIIE family protein phosphatase [Planctomycetes bacterium]|nr:SpoIIE family protein phosphatase [Planctomycetota bacterium]